MYINFKISVSSVTLLSVTYISTFAAHFSASAVSMAIKCLKPSYSVDLCRVSCSVVKGRSYLLDFPLTLVQ
jgi:imidazole glycerol phosphate synthase subunit HisF